MVDAGTLTIPSIAEATGCVSPARGDAGEGEVEPEPPGAPLARLARLG